MSKIDINTDSDNEKEWDPAWNISTIYEEVEIEDMDYDEDKKIYYYPCPCGDKFKISLEDLRDGEDIARCPSCALLIRVIYDDSDFDYSSCSDSE